MFKTGETCQVTGTYRYAGHTCNINGCHRKWDEYDIRVERGKKFPTVGSCFKPAEWVFVRPS